jgi:hypothetical protein
LDLLDDAVHFGVDPGDGAVIVVGNPDAAAAGRDPPGLLPTGIV